MKKSLIILFFLFLAVHSQAQVTLWDDLKAAADSTTIVSEDTTAFDMNAPLYVPDSWDADLDSLLTSRYGQYYTKMENNVMENIPDSLKDSVYVARLAKLPRIIELPYNSIVRNYIEVYVERKRGLMEYVLGMSNYYFPIIEEILDRYDLPLELKYLAIVESALNPIAHSRMGACGLWQFILPTGKAYGLEINSLVDERRDPVKSTEAACKYFRDMYAIFGDWNLVIASYNCGEGNVKKAIRRAGGNTDYWEIYPYLPKETRSYVPFFIAANYAMNYYAEHGLNPIQIDLPLSADTVMVNDPIHFEQISDILNVNKEELRALNPQYKKDIIPGNTGSRVLKLPLAATCGFVELEDTIIKHRSEDFFANRTYVGKQPGGNNEKITHRVTKGESVVTIASQYGVTTANIRKWNGLKSNRVAVGRRLTIYVDNGGVVLASVKKETTKTNTSSTPNSVDSVRYKVKSGDSYYTIAKRFPGYTAKNLMDMNNVKKSTLVVGQYINVPNV